MQLVLTDKVSKGGHEFHAKGEKVIIMSKYWI